VESASARDRLLTLLRARSFSRRKVILASGRESDFFIDCKQTVLLAEGHALIGQLMYEALAPFGPAVAVAGVELGGCPLVSAVAMHSFQVGCPVDALYVRKAAKDHGSKRLIEGSDALPKGSKVIVLEDTATTGGSALKAVGTLREGGFEVLGVLAICDRLEGAAEAMKEAGLPFRALYTRHDFIPAGT
jgi:orotate phosphoribosyltransferase